MEGLSHINCSSYGTIFVRSLYALYFIISYVSPIYAMHKIRISAPTTMKSLVRMPSYFSMSLAEKSAQLPLKIAIAGAGVGGVMLAYALQKKGFDVTVFEKTSKFSRFGGPLQLASNALSCMNDVSPDLFDQVMGR